MSSKKRRGQLKEDPDAKNAREAKRSRQGDDEDAATLQRCFGCDDLVSVLFSFLDIKSLHAVSKTNKPFANVVTHEHVIVSSLHQGGHAKTNIQRLVSLIETRSIWIPSPLRMLRLVNGKRCEHCNSEKVNLVPERYGVFVCFHSCLKKFTKKVTNNNTWSPYLAEPRIRNSEFSNNHYLWLKSYTDTAGERCGPILSISPEITAAMRGQKTIAQQLEENDAADPYADDASDIVQVLRDHKQNAEKRLREAVQKKEKARSEAIEQRKSQCLAIIEALSKQIGEHPFKEAALTYRWGRHTRKIFPLFCHGFVEELLADLFKSSGKVNAKKIAAAGVVLREQLDALENKHFFDFQFLSVSEPFEKALKDSFLQTYPDHELLKRSFLPMSRVTQIIAGDKNDLVLILEDLQPHVFRRALHPSIVAMSGIVVEDELMTSGQRLFHSLWAKERDMTSTLQECYNICLEKFPSLYQNLVDFMKSPEADALNTSAPLLEQNRFLWRVSEVLEPLSERDFRAVAKVIQED